MNTVVIDLDGTLTIDDPDVSYPNKLVNEGVRQGLLGVREKGYKIVIYTARNMRTYEGNVGKINIHTIPVIVEWLSKNDVPYDELIVGKPWCGKDGYYVDDKAIRPSEFASLSDDEIKELLKKEKKLNGGKL